MTERQLNILRKKIKRTSLKGEYGGHLTYVEINYICSLLKELTEYQQNQWNWALKGLKEGLTDSNWFYFIPRPEVRHLIMDKLHDLKD